MLKFFKSFRNDECGAVTVDWVVLTAAVVALAAAAYGSVSDGVDGLSAKIETELGTNVPTASGL
jgi:Flp pilus assembly pilin Flp